MKINNKLKTDGYITFGENEEIIIFLWCDWAQWLPNKIIKWNWKNVTFITLRYEDDIMTGGREIELGLIGFNLKIRWTHKTPEGDEFSKKTDKAIDTILNKSFYAWASEEDIENFKNKTDDDLPIVRTRKRARELGYKNPTKLFIQ